MISRIIKDSVRVINRSLRLRLIIPTSTLIILDITKPHPIVVYYLHISDENFIQLSVLPLLLIHLLFPIFLDYNFYNTTIKNASKLKVKFDHENKWIIKNSESNNFEKELKFSTTQLMKRLSPLITNTKSIYILNDFFFCTSNLNNTYSIVHSFSLVL